MASDEFRIEHDTMGEVQVPASARWGAQTQRAVENFPISGLRIERALIGALASIKGAASIVNLELGVLPEDVALAIHDSAVEVPKGQWDDQFPVDVFQTGSGHLHQHEHERGARQPGHRAARTAGAPERRGQRVAVVERRVPVRHPLRGGARDHRRPAARRSTTSSARSATKADGSAEVVKAGRTHLMDATPVTLGQELGGYAAQVEAAADRMRAALPRVGQLPLGGTAVGTGHQRAGRVRRRGRRAVRERPRPAALRGARPLRRPGRARRAGRPVRRPAGAGGGADQDRQRPPLDGLGTEDRPGRDPPARPAAGQLDHARQGEPGDPRGGHAGRAPR